MDGLIGCHKMHDDDDHDDHDDDDDEDDDGKIWQDDHHNSRRNTMHNLPWILWKCKHFTDPLKWSMSLCKKDSSRPKILDNGHFGSLWHHILTLKIKTSYARGTWQLQLPTSL